MSLSFFQQQGWLCPITYDLMTDPVVAEDGQTYDRASITEWLSREPISPLTRTPMSVAALRPNIALRSQIQSYLSTHPQHPPTPIVPPKAFEPSAYEKSVRAYKRTDGSLALHFRVTASAPVRRQPLVLIPIIDNSGSMGEQAQASEGVGNTGFTRLDLVLYGVRVLAALLGDDDYMGVVSFSTEARKVIDPIRMNADGKARINAALDSIRPDANTNIWDGIRKAAAMANDPLFEGQNIVAMLLTDGYPNQNPPRGLLPTLKAMKLTNPWTLHAFGFGNQLDSELLSQIADWGKGLFGFIPSSDMVGTVFINAVAHALTTAIPSLTLSYKENEGAPTKSIVLGPIAHEQPRDILINLPAGSNPHVEDMSVEVTSCDNDPVLIHADYIELIKSAIRRCATGDVVGAQTLLAAFHAVHKDSADPHIQAMMRDIRSDVKEEGQIGMSPSYFNTWGQHYMRAYASAQSLQQCMNFKDPGLQIYGGDLFHSLQDEGDTLFASLPVPKASGRRYDAVAAVPAITSMSVFHNASSGCFAPESQVRMADNTQQHISALKVGDSVWTPTGPVTIRAVVTCGSYKRTQPMSNINGLVITPWHPVRVGGRWQFPADISGYTDRIMPAVYNLVLSAGHIVDVNGIECCTLAHGFSEDVVRHDYFGTQRVIDDLMKQPGWDTGYPVYKNLATRRDPATDMIIGWYDDV